MGVVGVRHQVAEIEALRADLDPRIPLWVNAFSVDGGAVRPGYYDAETLAEAWRWASRIRNATMLLRGKASDTIPTDMRDLAPVADLLGYPKGSASDFIEDWMRRSRAVRKVMDRLFWED